MTIEEVYKYYITAKKAAEAIHISRETFHKWVRAGWIPYNQQCRYEEITSKALIASKINDSVVKDIFYPQFRFWSDTHGMCNVISLTFLKSKILRIKAAIPETKHPLVSFETSKLMQSAYLKDSKGKLLFEKDIVLVNRKNRTLESVFDFELLELLRNNKFFIVGNLFEGGKDGN